MKCFNQISVMVLCIVVTAPTCSLAAGNSHAKDEATLKEDIRKMDAATSNKDLGAYIMFLHPDYMDISQSGAVNAHSKNQMRDQMRLMFARATSISITPTMVTRCIFDRQNATVYHSGSLRMTLIISGRESVIQSGGTYRDTWVKTGTGWLIKQSVAVLTKTTLDGKRVP